ncbi:MAG: hypothetical protein ACJAR2_003119 [Ilumatobacter sp.]|jgi:hypothetical protein
MEATLRAHGRFGATVESLSPNALDRFIAFTGRTTVNG